jgi:hypothetical protein
MSNAYDSASLLVTPNGYEAGTIFSAKPTDGSGDLSFSRASTALRRNSAGLWEEVANDVPRLQYPVGGGCPSWLFEPQATNIVLNSIGNASNYTYVFGASGTDETTTTPFEGVTSAVKITTAASFFSGAYKIISRASAINVSYGIFKKIDLDWVGVLDVEGIGVRAWFNISNGTLGTVTSGYTARITDEGNGWYRCELTKDTAEASTYFQFICTDTNGSSIGAIGDTYICFAQNEAGSVATSPIITAGSAVTRVADASNTTGLTSIIGQTEGTFFVDYTFLGIGDPITNFSNILTTNKNTDSAIYILRNASNATIRAGIIIGGSTVFNLGGGNNAINTKIKIAFVYKSGQSALFINGSKIGSTNTTAFTFTQALSEINLNDATTYFGYQAVEEFDQAIIYKKALSDTEAEDLTAL